MGIALLNLGMPLKMIRGEALPGDPDFEESPLPLTLRLGVSHDMRIDKDNLTTVSLDYIQDFYDYGRFAVGMKHNVINMIILRAGYDTSVDTRNPSYFSAGAGINISQIGFTLGFNYVYRMVIFGSTNAPGQNHGGSVSIKF